MRKQIIKILFLCLTIGFAGCSKDELIVDINPDPDIPPVESTDEKMKAAVENLEKVETAMSPLFLACEDANELGGHLEEIKAMDGVEDAWVEDSTLLSVRIEDMGLVFFYYPPKEAEIGIDFPIERKATMSGSVLSKSTDPNYLKSQKICIINQQSRDLSREICKEWYKELVNVYRDAHFDVREVNGEEFTADFLCKELPKYGLVFMITHGAYSENNVEKKPKKDPVKKVHWIATGVESNDKTLDSTYFKMQDERLMTTFHVKETRKVLEKKTEVMVPYICVNEDYIDKCMDSFLHKNSIMFNTACQSLKRNNNLWDILKNKHLGCYLGYDNDNIGGKYVGVLFLESLLSGKMNVSEAYELIESLGYDIEYKKFGWTELELHPSDCSITLFDQPALSDEEVVDLGLSVNWAGRNLEATSSIGYGGKYENYDYIDIYYESPELFDEENDGVNLAKTKYDYAYQLTDGSWRMPTIEELRELKEKCQWKAEVVDNVPGFRVTGPSGKSIFLPAELQQEPGMGIYVFNSTYASSRLGHSGLMGVIMAGAISPFGVNVVRTEEMWVLDYALIRPVCDR